MFQRCESNFVKLSSNAGAELSVSFFLTGICNTFELIKPNSWLSALKKSLIT